MKKEFLDFLYEERARVQIIIDRLVALDKSHAKDVHSPVCVCDVSDEILARRAHIYSVNMAIEKYLELHPLNR